MVEKIGWDLKVIVPTRVVIWWRLISVFREIVEVTGVSRGGNLDIRTKSQTSSTPVDSLQKNKFNALRVFSNL